MSIGLTEIIILAIIALVVMGPEKFPDFAKLVLRTVRDLRGYMDEVKSEVAKELRPVQKELNEINRKSYLEYDRPKPTNKTPSPDKKSAASPTPAVPPKEAGDAQNIVDPTLVEESSTYPYRSQKFEQVSQEGAPAEESPAPKTSPAVPNPNREETQD